MVINCIKDIPNTDRVPGLKNKWYFPGEEMITINLACSQCKENRYLKLTNQQLFRNYYNTTVFVSQSVKEILHWF